jgi:hypothetical protein
MTTNGGKGGFTKGPWLYRGKSDDVWTAPPEGTNYSYGEFIFGFKDEFVPKDADLNLILAAPDLLEALKLAYDSTAVLNHLPVEHQHIICAAIARAEGEG